MSSAGIPVYAAAGRDGGIKLYDDFIINKALLSESDIQDILIGLLSLSAARYPDHESTLEKLRALFKQTNTDWIEIDFSRWGACVQRESESSQKLCLMKFLMTIQKFCHCLRIWKYYAKWNFDFHWTWGIEF